jgi:hypothetical protein
VSDSQLEPTRSLVPSIKSGGRSSTPLVPAALRIASTRAHISSRIGPALWPEFLPILGSVHRRVLARRGRWNYAGDNLLCCQYRT